MSIKILCRRRSPIGLVVLALTVLAATVLLAPSAVAEGVESFRDAVTSARGDTSCGALRYNPVVEQAADLVNRSTDDYLDQKATQVPILDPRPALKNFGYSGENAVLLQGAAKNDGDSIKGAILEGFAAMPDCSYTDFGVSIRKNETTGYKLSSLILAGS